MPGPNRAVGVDPLHGSFGLRCADPECDEIGELPRHYVGVDVEASQPIR
jgi:hypothetical protein